MTALCADQRLAPALYLDVVDVCDSPQGLTFGGVGPALDVAVRMRRLPDGALWSEMLAAGILASCHIDALALRLVDFHRDAAVAPAASVFGSAASHEKETHGLMGSAAMQTASAAR